MSPISFAKIKKSEIHYKGITYSFISRSVHLTEIGDKHLLRLNILYDEYVVIAEVTKIETFAYDGNIKIHYKTKFGEGNCIYENFHFIDYVFGKTKVNLASKDFWKYIKNIRRIKCRKLI